jgi:hypothetical protein
MFERRGRAVVSKLAVPVALVVILVVAGAYVFFIGNSTTVPTSTGTSTPTVSVHTAVNQLVQDVNDRNVDGVATFYNQNSLAIWSGNTGGLSGRYSGAGNIKLIYATTVGKTTKMNANVSNYAEKPFSPTHINATYVIGMLANSTVAGILTATISVSEEWNWGGGGWQISRENWAYNYFDSTTIDLNKGGDPTTFPQWGVMRVGGNPDLVSEKSFEWHAGPYLAAAVYAFLFSMVSFLVVRTRQSDRGRVRQWEQRRTPPT